MRQMRPFLREVRHFFRRVRVGKRFRDAHRAFRVAHRRFRASHFSLGKAPQPFGEGRTNRWCAWGRHFRTCRKKKGVRTRRFARRTRRFPNRTFHR